MPLGVRRTQRGAGGEVVGNAEYSFVLPDVDKVAIVGLASVEIAAVATQSAAFGPSLHMAIIGAIAGLGGYSMFGKGRAAKQRQADPKKANKVDSGAGSSEGGSGSSKSSSSGDKKQ